jgi:hypothetical protein
MSCPIVLWVSGPTGSFLVRRQITDLGVVAQVLHNPLMSMTFLFWISAIYTVALFGVLKQWGRILQTPVKNPVSM